MEKKEFMQFMEKYKRWDTIKIWDRIFVSSYITILNDDEIKINYFLGNFLEMEYFKIEDIKNIEILEYNY